MHQHLSKVHFIYSLLNIKIQKSLQSEGLKVKVQTTTTLKVVFPGSRRQTFSHVFYAIINDAIIKWVKLSRLTLVIVSVLFIGLQCLCSIVFTFFQDGIFKFLFCLFHFSVKVAFFHL